MDAGAFEVVLKAGGFEHRRRFGQRHEQNFGEVGVFLEAHQRCGVVPAVPPHLPCDLAVVGTRGVEQQQGVAGGCGVEDDERAAGFVDDFGKKGLEDCDFLGAR